MLPFNPPAILAIGCTFAGLQPTRVKNYYAGRRQSSSRGSISVSYLNHTEERDESPHVVSEPSILYFGTSEEDLYTSETR